MATSVVVPPPICPARVPLRPETMAPANPYFQLPL
jgi:hypothetical protein